MKGKNTDKHQEGVSSSRSSRGEREKRAIRVLVVDDSAFMRRIIGDIVSAQPDMELVGVARNGEEALVKRDKLAPDLMTLDLEMPKMGGLTALKQVMTQAPLPVIIVSTHSGERNESTLEALEAGAVDFVPKPSQKGSDETLEELKKTLPLKIRAAAGARLDLAPEKEAVSPARREDFLPEKGQEAKLVLALGASTGGPRALEEVLSKLPPNLPAAIMITQHMPSGFTLSFSQRLDLITPFKVREVKGGERLYRGNVYVAPGNYHLKLKGSNELQLDQGERVHHVRPAFDVMLESLVGKPYGIVAVVLTGMGKDGSLSTVKLKKEHPYSCVIVQDPKTSVIRGMPEAVIATGCSDRVVPLADISREIVTAVRELQEKLEPKKK